jgi:molybdate transport system substrate-binding protein
MKALSSMATRGVLTELLASVAPGAVELESVGGVDAARRVGSGEAVDLVFLADGALRRLAGEGRVGAVVPLLLSRVAVGVPGDSAATVPSGPAYRSAAELREALLAASRIGYSTGPSGDALVGLIGGWGLAHELEPRLVQASPGIPVARLIADGEVDLGLQQLSELVGHAGVRVLGALPDECAIETTFSGAVATASTRRDAAATVLADIASEATVPIRNAHAFAAP